MDVILIFNFELFFALLTPLTTRKIKIKKKKIKKMPGDIILHMCTKNNDHMMYGSWNMVCNKLMDRQMDGQKKWHIEVGAPPKKTYPENPSLSHTTSYSILIPCQNLEKTNDTIPRKCLDRQKDRWKDRKKGRRTKRPYFIGPFWLPLWVQ